MGLSLVALFIIFAAVIGSAAMVGVLSYMLSRVRRLEGGMSGDRPPRQLTDQMNTLADELMALLHRRNPRLLQPGDDPIDGLSCGDGRGSSHCRYRRRAAGAGVAPGLRGVHPGTG